MPSLVSSISTILHCLVKIYKVEHAGNFIYISNVACYILFVNRAFGLIPKTYSILKSHGISVG